MNFIRVVIPLATLLLVTLAAQPADAALALSFEQTSTSCNGGTNGRLAVNVTGGSGQYAYAWSSGLSTGPEATGLGAGQYQVTVTDLVTDEVVISAPQTVLQPSAVVLAPAQTNVTCAGASNGSASVTPSGGVFPYSYQWTPSVGTGPMATGLSAGSYTVAVLDGNGCYKSATFAITEPAPLRARMRAQTNLACNGGSTGSITAEATGGTPGYTYRWTPTNETTASISGLTAGTYTLTVTDANACTSSTSTTIDEPATPLTLSTSQSNVACNGGSNGTISAVASGGMGAYTYYWSTNVGSGPNVTGLDAGNYTLTVYDLYGCMVERNFTITQPARLEVAISDTDVSCHGSFDGAASAVASGGTGSYRYAWSPGGGSASTATGLAPGAYTVTVSDDNGCATDASVTINEPAAIEIVPAHTDVSCHGGSDGTANAIVSGGTGSYTYAWSPGGGTAPNATGLAPGAYTLTVSDDNACATNASVTIDEPAAIEIVPSQIDVSCPGGSDGTANAIVSGGTGSYTYAWSPGGGTAPSATGLDAGAYTLTVTDDNACVRTHEYALTAPPVAVITVDALTNATCHGSADGGASVSVTGGTPGYTYAWSPSGGTEPTLEAHAAGTYTVTVTDANACEYTHSLAVAEPEAIVVTLAASTPADCSDAPGGALTVAVSGGSDGYAYDWSPGEPAGDGTESISGLAVGAYAVHVEDMNGCAGEGSFEVVAATDIAPVATGSSATVAQDGSVGLTLTSTYAGCFDRIYRIVDGPENGTLDGVPPEVVYSPAPGYFGPDAFTFEVTANGETSAPALVELTVTETPVSPENAVPTAHSMTITTEVETPVTLTLSGSDLDGDPLTFVVETEPRFGTLSGTPPLVTYTPAGTDGYEDEFTFVVDDGEAISAPATVSVIVEAPIDPGEDPVDPGKNPPTRKGDDGGCSAAGNGELLGAILLVGAFLGLRRRKAQAA